MKVAAVLGGARGGFDELAKLRAMCAVDAVYAVNDAAAEYPDHLDAFVTLHPEKLPLWLTKRSTTPARVVAHEAAPGVTEVIDYRFPGMNASGSSGLFAVKAALDHGFDRVVLCGVPMDPARTHYEQSTFRNDHASFTDAWSISLPYLRERVRSMSGWTAMLLGLPTKEWLA